MAHQLKININARSGYLINRRLLRQTLRKEFGQWLSTSVNYQVSVSIVGNRLMRRLEKTYFKQDKTTDVLSFPMLETKFKHISFPENEKRPLFLGEIVISYPQARLQASQKNQLIDQEICRLASHGLRHLLGINHN